MQQYAIKTIATGILLAVAIGVTYSMTRQTPEEVIEEANQEIIRTWKAQQSDCQNEATQTGTSTEILQKLSICRDTPIPELKRISTDGNSGSVARVSILGTVAPASTGASGYKDISLECEFGERTGKVEGIEYHYTATDSDTTLQAIKNSHVSKGQEHIGYHYVIKPNGEITNTRDEKCIAGADKWSKNNYRFIQIAFVGDDKPTEKQTESILALTKQIQIKYKLPIDAVSAHSEWGPKSKKESLDYWYGSKWEFIKRLRYQYAITIYNTAPPELWYMWKAWGDLDFIGTIYQESRMNNNSVGDGGQSIGYCQIHKGYQPGWYANYLKLETMQERLNYCHELYNYAKSLKGGVGSRFHGYDKREQHIKNILIN